MRVVHEPDGHARALATDVDIATSFREQTIGLMGKSSIPEDYALVFEFGDPDFLHRLFDTIPRQYIHMLFVRMPLDVVWLRENEVINVKTLSPWVGIGSGRADVIVELPAGTTDGVEVGDTVVIEGRTDGEAEGGEAAESSDDDQQAVAE